MMNTLAVLDRDAAIEGVTVLASIVRQLRESVFVKDADYGVIPNTGSKPVLLLPGMEKLMRALNLRAEYVEREKRLDFDGGLFYFEYECRLMNYDSDICVSTAIGSANSYESKWRWREQKRRCPACGAEAIIKGKQEYGGGWLCFKKQNGCGAKFSDGDAAIEAQTVGRVQNPDIADQLNTICKIAQKRALASAIKGAANVSEFFTVDLDDLPAILPHKPSHENVIEGEFTDAAPPEADAPPQAAPWTEADMRQFVKQYRAASISDAEALAALGVSGLKAWRGALADAEAALDAYITSQLAAPADKKTLTFEEV